MRIEDNPRTVTADRIWSAVEALQAAREDVARCENALKTAQAKVLDLEEFRLPALLDDLGSEIYRLPDGTTVEVGTDVSASVPLEKRREAFDWLDANGHSGLIKRSVIVSFTREQEAQARDLLEQLRATYPAAKEEKKVEPSTLSAWVRSRLREGEPVPDCVETRERRVAKVKAPSGRRA